MIVVSDSTTLIILSNLNRFELLQNIFSTIIIPQKVYDEINFKSTIHLPDFIKIVKVKEDEKLQELKMLLDDGESEAIVLSLQEKLPLIIDEKKGRKIAKNLNIDILGLLGVLYLNIKKEFIGEDEAKDFLKNAKQNGYRISQKLINEMFKSL